MSGAEDRAESIRMIRDSAAAVAPVGGDTKRIRALRFTDPGFDREVLARMGELGWIGLRVGEDAGGAGLGMQEFCALCEALGGGLVPEPLIACAAAARLVPQEAVLAGRRIVLPALQERANALAVGALAVGALAVGALAAGDATRFVGGRVSGRKVFVPMAGGADAFLVATRDGLALVEAGAPGLHVAIDRTQDGGTYGTLTFENAPGEAVAGDPAEAIEEATLATASYLLGVMERVFALTLEYLKTRQQFGRVIGSFQALQHRAADLSIQIALTRASVEAAAVTLDEANDEALRLSAVSRAKARASEAAMLVTRQAIQLHGGIGYTDEYDAGLYLRKAMVLANQYGSATLHRARFGAAAPAEEEAA